MPGRVKLTTQAVEEHVPGNSPKKRAASAPAAASAVKKAKVTPTSSTRAKTLSVAAAAPPTKKPKPSREKSLIPNPCLFQFAVLTIMKHTLVLIQAATNFSSAHVVSRSTLDPTPASDPINARLIQRTVISPFYVNRT